MNTNLNTIENRPLNQTTIAANDAFLDKFEAETGMPYSAAVELAVEARSEQKLYGTRRQSRSARSSRLPADNLRGTGWTYADALDEVLEQRRDQRLYGKGASRLN